MSLMMQNYNSTSSMARTSTTVPPTHPGSRPVAASKPRLDESYESIGCKLNPFLDSNHSPSTSTTDDETRSMTDSCSSLGNHHSYSNTRTPNGSHSSVPNGISVDQVPEPPAEIEADTTRTHKSSSSSNHNNSKNWLTPIPRGSERSRSSRAPKSSSSGNNSRGPLLEDESIYLDDMTPPSVESRPRSDDRLYYGSGGSGSVYGDDRSHSRYSHRDPDDRSHYGDDRSRYGDDQSQYGRGDGRSRYGDDRSRYGGDDRSHYGADDRSHYGADDLSHYGGDDRSHYGGDDRSHYGGDDGSYYPRSRYSSSRGSSYASGSASVSAIDSKDYGYHPRSSRYYSSSYSSSSRDRPPASSGYAARGYASVSGSASVSAMDEFFDEEYSKLLYSSSGGSGCPRGSASVSGAASLSGMDQKEFFDDHDDRPRYSSSRGHYSRGYTYGSGSASVSAADNYRHDDYGYARSSSRYSSFRSSSRGSSYPRGSASFSGAADRFDDDGVSVGAGSVYSRRPDDPYHDDGASVGGGGSVYSRRHDDYYDDGASVGGGSVYSRASSRYPDRHSDRYYHSRDYNHTSNNRKLSMSEPHLHYDAYGSRSYSESRHYDHHSYYNRHRSSASYSSSSTDGGGGSSSSRSCYGYYDRDRQRYGSSRDYYRPDSSRYHSSSRQHSSDYNEDTGDRNGSDRMCHTDTTYSVRRGYNPPLAEEEEPSSVTPSTRSSRRSSRSSRRSSRQGGSTANVPRENLKPAPGTKAGPVYLEVSPGIKARFRKSEETKKAIEADFYDEASCWGCHASPLYYTADLAYILCPNCTCISRLDKPHSNKNREGVGIALTEETLYSLKCEIAAEGGRVSAEC